MRDSLGCKDGCANTNSLTYLLACLLGNPVITSQPVFKPVPFFSC